MMDAAPVELTDLAKTYEVGVFRKRHVRALSKLSLKLHRGEIFGLLGPNGAGKSTAIKILMNLVQPTLGKAVLFGEPPSSVAGRRRTGYLPENPAPYEYLTGSEFVTLSGALGGLSGPELRSRVTEVIEQVGMTRGAPLQIRRYSKGMIQRIALAHALVNRPELLVLDEPTSGLDPVGRRQIRDLILAEKERGTTVLYCTHIIPDIESICDRVAVLVGGEVVREGTVASLLSNEMKDVEIVFDGAPSATVEKVLGTGYPLRETHGRIMVRVGESDAQRVIAAVSAAEGRILQVQAVRFSLEDLFMRTVQQANASVGAELS